MSSTRRVSRGGRSRSVPHYLHLFGLILLFVAGPAGLAAQDNDTSASLTYGVYANFQAVSHSADFNEIPGFPKAPALFEDGDGSGLGAGLLLGIPAAKLLGRGGFSDKLNLELRGGIELRSATLETDEPTFVILRSGERVPGNFRHTIDADFRTLALAALLRYEVFDGFHMQAGPQFGFDMGADFSQRQELTEPAEAELLSGERAVDLYSADLAGRSSPAPGLKIGAAYQLPLSETWSVALEGSYVMAFGDVVENLNWQAAALEFGAVLRFQPPPSLPVLRDTIYLRDTVERETPGLAAARIRRTDSSVENKSGFEKDREYEQTIISEQYLREVPAAVVEAEVEAPAVKREIAVRLGLELQMADKSTAAPRAPVEVEETVSTRYTPLLNYVFFDENQSALPARYRRLTRNETAGFNADSLYASSTLQIYHNVLNVIGARMQADPAANLRLRGHIDESAESGNAQLAGARAEAVRDYLMRVWDIDPARLKIESRGRPARPSNAARAEGRAENRRVEILSDESTLLEPLFARNTIYRSEVQGLIFQPIVTGDGADVKSWRIRTRRGGLPLSDTSGTGLPPRQVLRTLDETFAQRYAAQPVESLLEIKTADGRTIRSQPVGFDLVVNTRSEQLAGGQGVTHIERYSLLLFDFDDVSLSDENRSILRFITSRLRPGARVRIIGKTDEVGDAAYNRDLSYRRAQSVARALDIDGAEVAGLGEDHGGPSNALPEGRFYNRTVVVEIESVRQDD